MNLRDELMDLSNEVAIRRLADYGDELVPLIHEVGQRRLRGAVDQLRSLLIHPDDRIKQAAVEALGDIGDDSGASDILKLARHPNISLSLRNTIAWSLGSLRYAPAVTVLAQMLQDDEPSVRSCAAAALAAIADPTSVPALLLASARERDSSVKEELEAVLKLFGPQEPVFPKAPSSVPKIPPNDATRFREYQPEDACFQ